MSKQLTNFASLVGPSTKIADIKRKLETDIPFVEPLGFKKHVLSNGVFLWIPLLPIFLVLFLYRIALKSSVLDNEQVTQSIIKSYQWWFEDNYTNAKLVGRSDVNLFLRQIQNYRGEGIPSDAVIEEIQNGYSLKIEDTSINTAMVFWKWVRSNGKTTTVHREQKNYFYANNFPDDVKKFELRIYPNTLLRKNTKDLENDNFNKKFSYKSNDPLKLRLLFTPVAQEDWASLSPKIAKTISFDKIGDSLISSVATKRNLYGADVKNLSSADTFYTQITQDFVDDLDELQKFIAIHTTLRRLFKK